MNDLIGGRYEILAPLGQGGMAAVFRARDRTLGRIVALKLLPEGIALLPAWRARFEREAKVMARLSHPNLVSIHDAGLHADRPFLVMELVEGGDLQDLLDGQGLDRRAGLELFGRVARAVAVAHEHGIVHRDLKPANVLVTSDGRPLVCDFGLAHVDDAESRLTGPGSTLGTPLYMSPEQIEGPVDRIRPATDVYSLGVMLYQHATGELPYRAESSVELFRRILGGDARPPSLVGKGVDRDLESIIQTAMHVRPARRYPTAGELADDLERYLAGDPVSVRPISAAERLLGRARRRWRTTLALSLVAVSISVAVGWRVAVAVDDRRRVEATLAVARAEESAGRLVAARDGYRSIIDRDPGNAAAREGIDRVEANLAAREGKRRRALGLLETGRLRLERAAEEIYVVEADLAAMRNEAWAAQGPITEALEADPGLALGHHLLGRSLELIDRADEAEEAYRRAIEIDPDFGPARLRLGRLLLLRVHEENRFWERFERESGRPAAARARIARWLEEAGRLVERASDLGSGRDDRLARDVARALLALADGDEATVSRIAAEGLERLGSRRGSEDYRWLGALVGPDDERLADLEAGLAICPHHRSCRYERGLALQRAGRGSEAIVEFERLVAAWPRFRQAWTILASLVFLRDPQRALDHLDRALELWSEDAMALVNRAAVRTETGQPDLALLDIDRAIAVAPDLAVAHVNRAYILLATRRPEEALASARRAVELVPDRSDGHSMLGQVLLALGRPGEAEAAFGEAIERDPTGGIHYRDRADARLALGDPEGARVDLAIRQRLAIARLGGRAAEFLELARIEISRGDPSTALRRLEQAGPATAPLLLLRGNAYESLGRIDEAASSYEAALAIDPANPDALYHRAVLRATHRGDAAGARSDLAAALRAARPDWPLRSQAEAHLDRLGGR